MGPAFVIKAEELPALNYLDRDYPRPRRLVWINRGTDQPLKPSSIDMLLRTLSREVKSPSVIRLHQHAGLRAVFGSSQERNQFATAFAAARSQESSTTETVASAAFQDREAAQFAVAALKDSGIPDEAISIMWRASKFRDADYRWSEGHSNLSVAGAVASGGVAGAMFGVAVLFVPGVGPIATAGILAASAFSSVAAVSGIIGATGGAIAKMLTDHDVDGVAARYFDEEIRRGKVFVSVDSRMTEGRHDDALDILKANGGRTPDCH